ncbi:hypothetical protein EDD86DRAFT_200706 [Gorgonomyces haynaldii]|nr:hypothetical protein EDD86DRAFT_200706 [Gorgonomyces haynaldii]
MAEEKRPTMVVQKDNRIKVTMHPPSIPSRYHTIHYDDNEKKAFNSTSKRFEPNLHELPGPGYYARAAERVDHLGNEASISRKGYGVGFASQRKRFSKPPTDLELTPVAPSQYNPKEPTYSKFLEQSLSASFRNSVIGNDARRFQTNNQQMVRTRGGLKPMPAPGEYDPKPVDKVGGVPLSERGARFVFKSKTSRSGFESFKSNPPPGVYEVEKASKVLFKEPQGAKAAFKATTRHQLQKIDKMPGPGAYNIAGQKTEKKAKGQYLVATIAKPPAPPEEPSSNQVSVPGSGMTPIAFPSPGTYELAKSCDAVQRSVPKTRSVFVSKSPRFQVSSREKTQVGPGYYMPIDNSRQSYHLKLDGSWV